MGNSNSVKLKEKYQKNKFKLENTREDIHMKTYSIIYFQSQDPYIKKVLNPIQFSSFSDINYIVQILSQKFEKTGEFVFVVVNKSDRSLYDLVFEYGFQLKLPLKREKYFWILLENVVDTMVDLESKNLHYPILQKKFILERGHKNYILYLKDVLEIVYNHLVPVSKKNNFFRYMNQRNLHEFNMLVLSLIGDFDEDQLLRVPNFWQKCYYEVRDKVSQPQKEFFGFLFDPSLAPQSFTEIKAWLANNRQMFREDYYKNFYFRQTNSEKFVQNNYQTQPQRYKLEQSPQKIQKNRGQQNYSSLNLQQQESINKFQTPAKGSIVSNSSHQIFSNENVNYSNIQQQQNYNRIQTQDQGIKKWQNRPQNQNTIIVNLRDQNQVQPQVNQPIQRSFESIQLKDLKQEQQKSDKQNLLVFEDEEIDVQTINEEPILEIFDELDFEFVNATKGKQNQQKNFFRQDSIDQAEDLIEQLTPKEQIFVKKNVFQKQKSDPNKPNQVHQITQKDTHSDLNSSVKRILMKWDPNLKQHVKYFEYADGSQRKVDIQKDEQELCKKLSLSEIQRKEQTDQKTKNILSQNFPKNDDWKFILMNSPQGALLLFKTGQIKMKQQYKDMEKIVNLQNSLKPSIYHNVNDNQIILGLSLKNLIIQLLFTTV